MAVTLDLNKKNRMRGKIISIHSGKAGVGKSQLAVNLALAIKQLEKTVLLIDTNVLSSSIHDLLGVSPALSLSDVFYKNKTLIDVIEKAPNHLPVIFGLLNNQSNISDPKITLEHLIHQITDLTASYDYIILDHAAGLSEFIQLISSVADHLMIVTSPDPEAVSDAYALLKVLSGLYPTIHGKVVVNQVKSEEEAEEVFERLYLVVEHFLQTDVDMFGYLIEDKHVHQSVEKQEPFILTAPGSKAAKCIDQIRDRVL